MRSRASAPGRTACAALAHGALGSALVLCAIAVSVPGRAAAPAAQDEIALPIPETFERELEGRAGQVLVIDPQDGRLLGLSDPRRPFSETVPAHTLAQLVTAYGILSTPGVDARARVTCAGTCGGAPAHGDLDVESALAAGCQRYFRAMGERLGLENFRRAAWALGLGPSPSVEYVNGIAVIPAATLRSAVPDLAARGTGVALTPARAAAMIAILATSTSLAPDALVVMRRALVASVAAGEAAEGWRAGSGPPAAGKIGAADGERESWFVGYAPSEEPRFAVVVLVRGSGPDAARAGARLLSRYSGTGDREPGIGGESPLPHPGP
jgi:hypothetical protein